MIFSDLIAALSTLCLTFLLNAGRLHIYHIYLANTIASLMNSFQWPAFSASISLLIPKDQLVRFGGINQAAPALSMLFAPALAGYLIQIIGLEGIFFLDFASFLFASMVTILVFIPQPPQTTEGKEGQGNLLSEVKTAWKFICQREGLMCLMALNANTQFSNGLVQVLLTPLVLNFASSAVLGSILSVSGTGAILGSIIIAVWGGPQKKIYGLL